MKLSDIHENKQVLAEMHGHMSLFQDSLRIIFGLSPEVAETLIEFVRRHGETIRIRDQQIRQRAGGRAIQLLKQAHIAAAQGGTDQYDDPEFEQRLDHMGDPEYDEHTKDEANPEDEAYKVS